METQTASLTPEKLKTFPGLAHLSDQKAAEITQQIKEFAYFLFNFTLKQGGHGLSPCSFTI